MDQKHVAIYPIEQPLIGSECMEKDIQNMIYMTTICIRKSKKKVRVERATNL